MSTLERRHLRWVIGAGVLVLGCVPSPPRSTGAPISSVPMAAASGSAPAASATSPLATTLPWPWLPQSTAVAASSLSAPGGSAQAFAAPAAVPSASGSAANQAGVPAPGAAQEPGRKRTHAKILIGADGVRRLNRHYQPKECGEAAPNPYALYLSENRDGSCRICEEPYRVPRCPKDKPAMELQEEVLRTNTNNVVSFHGTLAYLYYSCTLRGGPCACSNTCGSKLELFPGDSLPPVRTEEEWEALERLAPEEQLAQEEARRKQLELLPRLGLVSGSWQGSEAAARYTSKSGQLFCGGDEGAVCCPIALHSASRRLDVIVTGQLLYEHPYEGTAAEYRLHLRSMCRVR